MRQEPRSKLAINIESDICESCKSSPIDFKRDFYIEADLVFPTMDGFITYEFYDLFMIRTVNDRDEIQIKATEEDFNNEFNHIIKRDYIDNHILYGLRRQL